MQVFSQVLNWVYPRCCAGCDLPLGAGQSSFCVPCFESVEANLRPCPLCAIPLTRSLECGVCRGRKQATTAIVAPYLYGGQLAIALRRIKYQGRSDLARPLATLYREELRDLAATVDVVTSVPLHLSRRVRRGFDQAALLLRAAKVKSDLGLVRRSRRTSAQAKLGDAERKGNVEGAFAVRRPARVVGRSVLIFDDVITTGATVHACARALLDAGAQSVSAFAVARTP